MRWRRRQRDFDPVDVWAARDIAPLVGCFRVVLVALLWMLVGVGLWGVFALGDYLIGLFY
jgi:hypothetical protein